MPHETIFHALPLLLMIYPLQFQVSRLQGFDVIRVQGIAVYLTVYPAAHPGFHPVPGEKQYYCSSRQGLLIVETTGYTRLIDPFHLQSLSAAIKWYGRTRLGMPNIEIRLTDPRRSGSNKPAD
ncbi:hypothetical protein HH214_06175 [Mucilaginibacter robiniae]|uniref:Uncharacterized protein n=1 Tax=Mucilaginibacter robiniae TaxID=2728022 RepID=A0A7L5DZN2_9SPHI|nr:hypothetical protein [Mucilaginibacter robiniae]QJD95489.1 hypothetical protein HH214_06175 [Mucilaginibacter robiniae]